MTPNFRLLPALALYLLVACTDSAEEPQQSTTPEPRDPVKELMTRFIEAKPGDVITIPEGTLSLPRSLTHNADCPYSDLEFL